MSPLLGEPKLDDLIEDLKRASKEQPPAIFDKWLYLKAAEHLVTLSQENARLKKELEVLRG